MWHCNDMQTGCDAIEVAVCGLRRGAEPVVVRQGRDLGAEVGMHPVGLPEEVAQLGWNRVVTIHQPAQSRLVNRFGMGPLTDLRELLRVAGGEGVSDDLVALADAVTRSPAPAPTSAPATGTVRSSRASRPSEQGEQSSARHLHVVRNSDD